MERVGKQRERVEWIGAMGERVAVWDWTEKDLEWTGRDWWGTGEKAEIWRCTRSGLGEKVEVWEWS